MFHMIITIIQEIIQAANFSRPLMFMSIVVVIFLISSPGAIATIIGAGTKLGIYNHLRSEKQAANEA